MKVPYDWINLSPSNPIQAAFQSIWAQFMADPGLMVKYGIPSELEGEDTLLEALQAIFEKMPGEPDNGELEDKFWEGVYLDP